MWIQVYIYYIDRPLLDLCTMLSSFFSDLQSQFVCTLRHFVCGATSEGAAG